MKKKRRQRVIAILMTMLMIVGLIPTDFGLTIAKADTTHTFTASTDSVMLATAVDTVVKGGPLGTSYFTLGTNSNNKNKGGMLELKRDTLTAGGYISFTVAANTTATVTVVARTSKSGQSSSVLLTNTSSSTSSPIAGTNTTIPGNTDSTASWSNLAEGTYYISSGIPTTDANVRYSSIEVVEKSVAPANGTSPVVDSATATDNTATTGKINLAWTTSTTGSGDGKVRISVSKNGGDYTPAGADIAFDAAKTYEYTPNGSGTYQFKIQGVIDTAVEAGSTTSTITYAMDLAKSVITATPADGKVTVNFTKPSEADEYTLKVYDSAMTLANTITLTADEITAGTKDVSGLKNGEKYYFEMIVNRITPAASSTSDKVYTRPYLAADDSNAIPGLSISNLSSTASATVIREAGKITVVQPSKTGGIASGGTTSTSFISAPATTGDFKISADVTVASTVGGTGRGVFLGAFSNTSATDATMQMSTAAFRGDGSGVMYNSKGTSRSAEAFSTPLSAGSLKVNTKYTLVLERSGSSYTSSIYKGTTLLGSKTTDSSTYGTAAANLVSGQSVIPAIAFCGVSATVENLKITSGTTTTFDASKLTGSFTPFYNNWSVADVPVISDVTVNNDGTILATVDGEIGITGASKIDVAMKNSAGEVVDTQSNTTFGTSRVYTFSPEASGDYTFVATASRIGETTVKNSVSATGNGFILPLEAPTLWAVTGNASNMNVSWSPVPEATNYKVEYRVQGTNTWTTAVASTTDLKASIPSLQAGTSYDIQLTATGALAGQTVSTQITKKLSDKEETLWKYSTFGASISTSNDKYTDIDNGVQISSTSGAGKLTGDGYDGLSFYYTEVPKTTNFVLSAKIKVDSWQLSNGQEGFMVGVRDTVGENGDASTYNYSNSFGFVGTKVEYNWDSVDQKVSSIGDQKITMKLGVGSRTVTGIKSKSVAPAAGTFASTQKPYDTSYAAQGAGSYNLVGNQKDSKGNFVEPNDGQTEFDVTLKKTNTGFEVIYTNAQGEKYDEIMYDWQEMYSVDPNLCYVGFAAARNMTISVTDIQYSTSNALTDPPAEERPIELITPNYKVTSPTATGNPNYTLVYNGNADGWVTVKDPSGNVIADNVWVTAKSDFSVASTLTSGSNKFVVNFVPDENYAPGAYQAMENYDPVEITQTVTLKQYGVAGETIYVSPTGSAQASGNIDEPMDIFTAVKYVQPGQTIILKEGTYELSSVLTIARGISGTADAQIRMIADPNATTRPVIDFMQTAAGFTAWGDYWYFRGFDITKSLDGQKGMQLSGNHCTLDQMEFYNNGNAGLQISGVSTETIDKWPSYNLILNCTSYNNADKGYEDADGFAAKLTCGVGNVFDGCIAHNNADDGWDLFAKAATGPIGQVTIKNCVAYRNGMLMDGTNAGNGNGFKMGGTNISGKHILINSVSYENKAKGIDSNSCPDIQVENCTSYNNGSYNVAFYSGKDIDTNFKATGILSYKTPTNSLLTWLDSVGATNADLRKIAEGSASIGEQIKLVNQDATQVYNNTNFFYDPATGISSNTGNAQTSMTFSSNGFAYVGGAAGGSAPFQSVDTLNVAITRYANGGINMNGLLQFTPSAVKFLSDAGITVGATLYEGLTPSILIGEIGPSVPAADKTKSSLATGDNTHIIVFFTLAIMSGAALVGLYFYDKKKKAFIKK